MAERTPRDLRYERKFVTTELGVAETEALIRFHPALFREAYHPRYVNNIYLDTPSLEHYHANVKGVARRVKCRIRWYGSPRGPVARPVLELKRKQGLVGSKESHPLQPFDLEDGFDPELLFAKSELPAPLLCDLAPLRPVLINRYRRRYFVSRDGIYRITVDSDLGYRGVAEGVHRFRSWVGNDGRVIIELKYGLGHEDEASRIATRFPFRVTRSSKYVIGVDALYAR
jgi:hypothetical protein